MNIDYNTVAAYADKAADVGNKEQTLAAQKILQEQKDRVDGQLASEIVALKQSGETSSEKYRHLLTETTALAASLREARAQEGVARMKEERLELASLSPQGAEHAIAEVDAKFDKVFCANLVSRSGHVDVPMPVISQDRRSSEIVVAAVKPSAVTDDGRVLAETSVANAERYTAAATTDFIIPTVVADLVTYWVTYPRLFNKFRAYQTMGVETLALNRITGIAMAEPVGATNNNPRGESVAIADNNPSYGHVSLRAIKVAGLTRVTPELLETLPRDMLQSIITDYLGQSLGLRFAFDAIRGNGSITQGQGIVPFLTANTGQLVTGKAQSSNVDNIDRKEITKLFAKLGGAYQSTVGGLTLAANTTTFWALWSNIQDSYPLFSDTRGFTANRLGPWEVCIDDAIEDVADEKICILAGDFMRGYAIRYGGNLRLEVSRDVEFKSDNIVIKAVQAFDTQPAEIAAFAGYKAT